MAPLWENAIGRIKESWAFVEPYPITQCGIRFSDQGPPTNAVINIARDYPFSEEELSRLGWRWKENLVNLGNWT